MLTSGDYIIESKIYLGIKFYPKPGRGLNLISHPTMFRIIALPADEYDHWAKIRSCFESFFGAVEGSISLFFQDCDREVYIDSALSMLNIIRNCESLFAPYANYVYTCIPAITRRPNDYEEKLERSINLARMFIEKYQGSILAEEMEFNLAWWLCYKDGTSIEFLNQAKKVIEKYPKNLNSYGIKKLLNRGLSLNTNYRDFQ